MARLSWQRCAACGRLVLVRFGSSPDCSCARPGRGAAPPASPFPSLMAGLPKGGNDGPPPLAFLTPEQDAVARRLLRQAFPDGFDF